VTRPDSSIFAERTRLLPSDAQPVPHSHPATDVPLKRRECAQRKPGRFQGFFHLFADWAEIEWV